MSSDQDWLHKAQKYKLKYLNLKQQYNNSQHLQHLQHLQKGGSSDDKTVYLFKADWCPHCVGFKPTWEKLEKDLGSKVKFVTYDSDKNKEEMEKFNIQGFPTIIMNAGKKSIEYVGPKDIQSVTEFINQY